MAIHHTPSGLLLEVRLTAGRCEIETADTDETVVEAEPMNDSAASRAAAEALVETLSERSQGGHKLVVAMPKLRRLVSGFNDAKVLVRIRAPHGAELDAGSASSDIVVRGRLGATEVRTASGDVAIETAEREIEVKTASGDVAIETAEQELEVKTASGEIRLGVLRGAGGVNTMSGDVSVGEAGGPLTVNTMSGDVNVKRLASASVQLRSMSGDLRAGIARGATLWVDANSASGDVRSELPVTGSAPAGGQADVELRATSMSGDITVVRAPESVAVQA
jgi:DUF4097 and DUF4098 domain-containing protein YvlB